MRGWIAPRIAPLAFVALAVPLAAATPGDEPPASIPSPPTPRATLPQGGLVALVPGTEVGDAAPEEALLALELAPSLSTSAEGLFEEELPNGGFRVDLQGRFRQVVFARLEASGELSVSHEIPAVEVSPPLATSDVHESAAREPEVGHESR